MARIVVGIQPVREAIRAHGAKIELVLVGAGGPRLSALARQAEAAGVVMRRPPPSELDRLARGVSHQGAVAFAPDLRLAPLAELMVPDAAIVVLDGVTDPHNFGAAIRSAVALGSGGVVFGENQAAPLTPATFRASAGAVEHAALCRVRSLRAALRELQLRGVTTVSLEPDAETALSDVDLRGPTAVVIGSEDRGVGRGLRAVCTTGARLPMSTRLGSLNASVAAAVALYEVRRQRMG